MIVKNLHAFTSSRERIWRGFVTYKIKNRRSIEAHLELPLLRKVAPGFRIHLGNTGSETPVDIHASAYWFAWFASLDFPGLGKFCELVGRGHKRNISMTVHSGQLWWELWYDDDMGYDDWHRCDPWRKPKFWPWSMGRKKYRPWMCLRHGNLELNPVDAFYGHRYFDHHDVGTVTALVPVSQFEGDEYEVEFTLQKETRGRREGPSWVRTREDVGWFANWKAKDKGGIPFRNHSWKGDGVYGSAEPVDLTTGEDWVQQAVKSLVERIKQDRIRYNYHPPRETVT